MASENSPPSGTRDLSIPIARAYVYMLVIILPLISIMAFGHINVWGSGEFFDSLDRFLQLKSLIPVLILGVPLHEAIHGFTWAFFGNKPLKDIKFGFQWKSLAPYAHLKVPAQARAYRAGAMMPALLMGVVPYLIGVASGRGWFTAFGLLYMIAAGGDLVVLWLLRKVDGDVLVVDHPSRAGCYVYD